MSVKFNVEKEENLFKLSFKKFDLRGNFTEGGGLYLIKSEIKELKKLLDGI